MNRLLRWGLGLALMGLLVVGAFLVLPFRAWLPGGTVADVPKSAVVNGTAFNRLFPSPQVGETIVFTQEKRGFSEARLMQGDQTLALLAISDTTTAPESRDKFSQAKERLQGWPLVEQAAQARSLLRITSTARFSTDALKSAQIPVTAMDLGGTMGHEQAQNLPPLESGADAAAAALAGGVAA
ncbi:MAG: hypothetical protein ACKOPS_15140 [Cyanobium sp.]